jgi:hypothetical protein
MLNRIRDRIKRIPALQQIEKIVSEMRKGTNEKYPLLISGLPKNIRLSVRDVSGSSERFARGNDFVDEAKLVALLGRDMARGQDQLIAHFSPI